MQNIQVESYVIPVNNIDGLVQDFDIPIADALRYCSLVQSHWNDIIIVRFLLSNDYSDQVSLWYQELPLLMWIKFNPCMDKQSHDQ